MSEVVGAGSHVPVSRSAPVLSKEQLCTRLRELHYDTDFPEEAVPVISHILTDLLKSVKSFHGLRARCEEPYALLSQGVELD